MLSARARRCLRVASLVDQGTIQPIMEVMGLDEAGLVRLLEDAEQAGIVELRGGRVVCNPADQAYVWDGCPDAERRALHAALARVYPEGSEESLVHAVEAATAADEVLASRLEHHARERLTRWGATSASILLRQAARISPPAARSARLAEAGRTAIAAGRLEEGDRLLADALDHTDDAERRADLVALRARLRIIDAEVGSALDMLLSEAARLSDAHPRHAGALLSATVYPFALQARLRSMQSTIDRARTLVGEPPDPLVESSAAFAYALMGRDAEVAEVTDELAANLPDAPVPGRVAWLTTIQVAQTLILSDQIERGTLLLERLIAVGRRLAAPTLTILPLVWVAEGAFRRGRWDEARRLLRDAERAESMMREQCWVVHITALPARLASAVGDVTRAKEALDDARLATRGRDLPGHRYYLTSAELSLLAATDDPQGAVALAGELVQFTDTNGVTSAEHTRWVFDAATAALATRDDALLERLEADLAAAVGRSRSAWVEAAHDAVAAMRSTDLSRAADDLGAAALRFGDRHPFDAGRSWLLAAEARTQLGDHEGALADARRAEDLMRRVGADVWRRRSSALIDELVRARQAHDPLSTLTERQQAVARAVVAGASNREVADRLGISPKTVENQLSRIYRALGVRSRTELTHLVTRPGDS